MEYKNINNLSWEQILRGESLQGPRSVNMQIQPIASQYFMHVDPSFNVHARSIYPDTPPAGEESFKFLKKKFIYEVDFAYDKYAKIFDPNRSRFKRIDNNSPVIIGEYFADGLKYNFKYFSTQAEKYSQDIITVEINIKNNNPKIAGNELIQPNFDGFIPKARNSKEATIWLKPQIVTDYTGHNLNYVPYRFNNKKWSYENNLELKDNYLKFKDGNIFGYITDTDMNFEICNKVYENIQDMLDKDQGHIHPTDINIDYPYSDQILEKLNNTLCFTKEIAPGEEAHIVLNIVSNRFDNSENTVSSLTKTYNYKNTIKEFNKARENKTDLDFKTIDLGDIFKACQYGVLQLATDFKENDYIIPTQGGINDRFYCWIWEAMFMITPMIKLGYNKLVKECIKFMFSLQDSGAKPNGEFTDYNGAIGSTGPRWICTTGSVLNTASIYLEYTKDEEFAKNYLPKMEKACDWILRQTDTTKIIKDGIKSPYYGLLPRGTMNDGDWAYGIGFSDLFSFVGVRAFTNTLKSLNHPKYNEYQEKCNEYEENLKNAFRSVAEPGGKIIKYVPSDKDSFYPGFEKTANFLFLTDLFDKNDELMIKFCDYMEKEVADGPFMHTANEEESYMGFQEHLFQHYYLEQHEFKKAWFALYVNIKYGMSADTFQVLERFSKYDPFWCPWQPNGSGSGRMIDMIINSIYFETENEIILFGGLPPAYIIENGVTELKELRIPNGKVTVKAVARDEKIIVSLVGDYDKNKKIILQNENFVLE